MKKSNEKALSFSYAFLGVRLQCARCQHRILLARSVFERRLKAFLSHAVVSDLGVEGN